MATESVDESLENPDSAAVEVAAAVAAYAAADNKEYQKQVAEDKAI